MNRTITSLTLAALAGGTLWGQAFEKSEDGAVPGSALKRPRSSVYQTPKLSPRLEAAETAGERVPVMVVYRRQPQRELVARVEESVAHHLELAEAQKAGDRLAQVRLQSRLLARDAVRQQVEGFQLMKAARMEGAGAVNVRRFWMHNMMTAEVTRQGLEELAADADVAEVFPVPHMRLAATVTNETIDVNTGVLGVASWWNAGIKGAGQPVVVLDTGINAAHPVFRGKQIVAKSFLGSVRNNRCFADDANSAEDRNGHGTHVAGIIAGAGDALLATFQGTAPEVNRIFALKIGANMSAIGECPDNSISGADVFNAIEWALENTPARIFNMSFGGDTEEDDPAFARVIDFIADTFNLTIVAAGGNEGRKGTPAIGDTGMSYNGITVANWDTRGTFSKQDDRVNPSSSLGPTPGGRFKPDVAAPGTQILSASHQGTGLVRLTGTSMAAPKVAGVVAMLHQAGVKDAALVKALLVNTTDQVGWKADRGWGLINMENARAANTLLSGDVKPSSFTLYRGRNNGNLYASLAWNRHAVESGFAFHDLDLFVYDAAGKELGSSESAEQNVEQVAVRTAGDVIVKVRSFDASFATGISTEKFGLAVSQSDFAPIAGPVLSSTCRADATTVAAGATVNVTCTLTNRGDLAGQETKAEFNWSGGTGGPTADLSTLAPGQSVERRYRVPAPNRAGSHSLVFSSSTKAAGETISGRTLFTLTVR